MNDSEKKMLIKAEIFNIIKYKQQNNLLSPISLMNVLM